MSTGSWFRKHRKQGAIHSCVIAGFLLVTLFAAEPLFDRLEAVPGEAQLHRISLLAETGDIRYNIEEISVDGSSVIEAEGWAFIEDHDSHGSQVFIVLESDRRTYVFDTMVRERPDVTAYFEDLGLDLDHSGFMALIPIRKMRAGEYVIGLYIRKGEIESFSYTAQRVEL